MSKCTVTSRSRDHTDFLAAEFRPTYQLRHSGLPLLWTTIVERCLENLCPGLVTCAKDATGLDESPPRHLDTLARTGQGKPASLNPQFTFAQQGPALDLTDLARTAVKNGALEDVITQMRPDAPVYRVYVSTWESATQRSEVR